MTFSQSPAWQMDDAERINFIDLGSEAECYKWFDLPLWKEGAVVKVAQCLQES